MNCVFLNMRHFVTVFTFLNMMFSRIILSLSCSPKYVPDVDDYEEDFMEIGHRKLIADCECGRFKTFENKSEHFPWLVKIERSRSGQDSKVCIGSIINDLFVLSSSSCLVDFENLTIANDLLRPTLFDMTKLQLSSFVDKAFKLVPKSVKCHPRAIPSLITSSAPEYDVCLIQMSHRINLKELTPVCVPEQSMKNVAGQTATSFGYRTFLEKRESTIFDSEYCKSNKRKVLCGQYGKTISDAFSFNNFGGPIMITLKSNQLFVAGVSSFKSIDMKDTKLFEAAAFDFASNIVGSKGIISFINKISTDADSQWCKQKEEFNIQNEKLEEIKLPTMITGPNLWNEFPALKYKKWTKFCKCGIRKSMSNPRIINGKQTRPHEYQWQAQIIIKKNRGRGGKKNVCSGTLINSKIILTSGHCVADMSTDQIISSEDIQVVLRAHQGFSKRDESSKETVTIKEVIVHPQFLIKRDFSYDIALFELEEHVAFSTSSGLFPICIPNKDEFGTNHSELIGKIGTTLGWGYTSYENGKLSDTLQEIEVPIQSQEKCNEGISGKLLMPENTICGGHLNYAKNYKGPTKGDSGGALMLDVVSNSSRRLVQIGIVSVGTLDVAADDERPAVWYTNVLEYLPFIEFFSFKAGSVWCL